MMGLCSLAGEARAGGKKKTVMAASLASSFLLWGCVKLLLDRAEERTAGLMMTDKQSAS
jgi:hypothetical protein